MGVRRKAREMSLQALYTMDLMNRWDQKVSDHLYDKNLWPESAEHAGPLLIGILEHRDVIDETIGAHADHWSVSRMNLIDRNLLRIAAYELLFCDDIPMKVSINEAIELGKIFGTRETKRFLNGILDRIAKQERGKTDRR
jgi:N utilization substance protein B